MARLVMLASFTLLTGLASAQQPGLERARKLMREGDYAAARAAVEAIVVQEPSNGAALHELARCARALGDLGGSIDAATRALAIPFQPRLSRLELAKSLALRGDREAAIGEVAQIAALGANKALHAAVSNAPELGGLKGDRRFDEAVAKLVPCGSEEYRQFDFWVGDWEVRDPVGNLLGRNDVRLRLDGCSLTEDWTSVAGHAGMSLNFYEPTDGSWNQVFVDNSGVPSSWPALKGKLVGGRMVLSSGKGATPETRWTWYRTDDGRVRQMAEQLSDDGKTWSVIWDSYYSKPR